MEIIVYDFAKICRSCLKVQTDMITIFDSVPDLGNTRILDVIKSFTSFEVIEGDGMPDKFCENCLNEIRRLYNFLKQLEDSDVKLKFYQQALHNAQTTEISELSVADEVYNEDPIDVLDVKIEDAKYDDNETLYLEEDEKKDIELLTDEDDQEYKINKKSKKCYFCSICKKSFTTKKNLAKHKQIHSATRRHSCSECGREFRESMFLKVHMRSHFTDEEKPFKCEQCDQQYAYQYQLTQHMYKHTNVKPFPCPHCDKGCVTADSLKRHLRVHDVSYEKRKHICNICQKEFAYPSFLAEHMKNHTGEKPYLCSYCGKGFRQKGALRYHIRIHTGNKPFTCEICKNNFMSQGILKVHMRRHTNERPYICDICGRAFRQSTDMRSHRRTHTGDKPVQCTVCSKSMATTGQLTIHMRMHTGEKPFSCPVCGKSFATKTMVVKHHRIHTGEKPYICGDCGKAFSQSSSLNTHLKIHSRNKEINCDVLVNI